MSERTPSEVIASGVEALIERLRDQGVSAGQARAEEVVAEAQQRAREVLQEARQEAERVLKQARADAADLERAGHDALRAASRDAVLSLKNNLIKRFSADVKRLVSAELSKVEVLQRMIVEIAGHARESTRESDRLRILLPSTAIDLEQVRRHPDEYTDNPLTKFVLDAANDMLRDGVTLADSSGQRPGLRVQVGEDGVVLDLTDEAIAGLLMEHLQPRFRAMLDGVVR